MEFSYQQIPALPLLSWCARVDPGSGIVQVFHGEGVETRPHAFIEGAWNGHFASFDLNEASIVAGTGAMLEGNRVRFIASTDHSGPLFSIRKADWLYVSNSPAFALAAADESPDDVYPFYTYDFVRIFRAGLACPDGQVLLQSETSLHVHFTTTLSVDDTGSIAFDTHPLCEAPRDYRSYKMQLLKGVDEVLENAAAADRTRRYRPLATVSRGYDSTATAVLARSAGCTDALTFVDGRLPDPNADNGAENAQYLGMKCREYGRWQYLDLDRQAEVEFGYVATASFVPFVVAEEQLAGSVLIGGEHGDVIWDPEEAKACDNMRLPSHGHTLGLSPLEFRLRVGYCTFGPACIAARHNRVLYAIAMSDEMRPWSIGGDYDRPIPRRIAEEAGLPRERFGMKKFASSHSHMIYPGRFSTKALDDYRDFVSRRHAEIPRDILSYWRSRVERRHRLWDKLDSKQRRHPASQHRLPIPIRVPWQFMFTFQWTVHAMRRRYGVAALGPGAA